MMHLDDPLNSSYSSERDQRDDDDDNEEEEEENHVDVAFSKKLEEIRANFQLLSNCSIVRVTTYDKENYDKFYRPNIVSIGPLHHGMENLQYMETVKFRYLDDLLNRSGNPDEKPAILRGMRDAVELIFDDLVAEYSVKVLSQKLKKDDLVNVFLLDGCFIIELFLKWYSNDIDGHLALAHLAMPLLKRDLLLLENQVPFSLLEALYFQAKLVSDGSTPSTFPGLALSYFTNRKVESLLVEGDAKVHHLLHLYHLTLSPKRWISPRGGDTLDKTIDDVSCTTLVWTKIKAFVMWLWISTKGLFVWLFGENDKIVKGAMENEEAGVTFEKKKKVNNSSFEVEFMDGKLMIPPLTINHNQIVELVNLLAFEFCFTKVKPSNQETQISSTTLEILSVQPPNDPTPKIKVTKKVDKFITAYVALLDSLIDTSIDVDVLQRSRIIDNQLSSHKEVAAIFNIIGTSVPKNWREENEDEHVIEVVRLMENMKNYCRQNAHGHRATLMKNYFNNAWSMIAVIAAIVLFLLTFVQTYFTIRPTK